MTLLPHEGQQTANNLDYCFQIPYWQSSPSSLAPSKKAFHFIARLASVIVHWALSGSQSQELEGFVAKLPIDFCWCDPSPPARATCRVSHHRCIFWNVLKWLCSKVLTYLFVMSFSAFVTNNISVSFFDKVIFLQRMHFLWAVHMLALLCKV